MAAKHSGKSASQVPISKHPAFPAIVALWFAALLGIGSLVLPASLFEAAIRASGLASVVPAAEPPLGVTARILIALVGAALGVVAGLLIARKVAAAQSQPGHVSRRPSHSAGEAAKRPISAHEELWSEGFDEPVEDTPAAPIAGRRRALSVTDESGPSELLDSASLPGGEAEIVFEQPSPAPESAAVVEAAEDDTLELAAFAESEADVEDGQSTVPELAEEIRNEGESVIAPRPIAPEPTISLEAARPFDAPPEAPVSFSGVSPAEQLRREFPVEPDAAFAIAPFAAPASPLEIEAHESPEPVADAPEAAAPEPETAQAAESGEAQGPALGELSIAELVDRFALSLQQAAARAEAQAQARAAAEAEARAEEEATVAAEAELPPRYVPDLGVEAIEAPRFAPLPEPETARLADEEPAEEPMTEIAGQSADAIPAALRPVGFGEDDADEDENEEFVLTLSLAPEERPFDRPSVSYVPSGAPAAQDAPQDVGKCEEAEDVADRGYSSLLDMRKQVSSREAVRIEDEMAPVDAEEAIEPVVIFPGQEQRRAAPAADRPADAGTREAPSVERPFAAPAPTLAATSDPMQTERALREALHKLQRLSGAA